MSKGKKKRSFSVRRLLSRSPSSSSGDPCTSREPVTPQEVCSSCSSRSSSISRGVGEGSSSSRRCLTCSSQVGLLYVLEGCSHGFCSPCLKDHVARSIMESRVPKCPQCGHSLRSGEVRAILEGECRLLGLFERQKSKRLFSLPRFLLSPVAPQRRKASSHYYSRGSPKEGGSSLEAGGEETQGASANGMEEEDDPDLCCLCLWERRPEQFRALNNCSHTFCVECLKIYTKTEIQEGRVGLKCPKCPESMHPNDVETFVDGDAKLLSLYEFLTLRKVLSCDPDVRWCPAPDCVYAVIATGCASCPKISCEGCPASFCYHCKAEWHPNQTCDDAARSSSRRCVSSSTTSLSDVKSCPRCSVLIVKMDDGSCNHITCSVCEAEFCWLCMKEISSLHYLSPSGCTFWGKKPWSRKKKLLCQLGTLVGAPLGIALLASISIPAMVIGIPIWTGTKLHQHYRRANKHKRNGIISTGVVASIIISPVLAGIAVSIGVPVLLFYVYGVVPILLCRSEECGLSSAETGIKIELDEEVHYKPVNVLNIQNPSIGEVSLGASLGSASHLDRDTRCDADRESASNTAVAGTSICGSIASSYLCQQSRLEVGADVHCRKKFSYSSERLSGGGGSIDNASTRAVLSCKFGDSQSMNSAGDNLSMANATGTDDQISLRSLPAQNANKFYQGPSSLLQTTNRPSASNPPRSVSPISSNSGDELLQGAIRRSSRHRRLNLDKPQISENSSLLSMDDYGSERVRFDENVSFINDVNHAASNEGNELKAVDEENNSLTSKNLAITSSENESNKNSSVISSASPETSGENQLESNEDAKNVTIVKV